MNVSLKKEDSEHFLKIDKQDEHLEWKDTIERKHKGGTLQIISKLRDKIMPSK